MTNAKDTNRAEFEANGYKAAILGDFIKNADGTYALNVVQHRWEAWQAARAQPERVALSDAEILRSANDFISKNIMHPDTFWLYDQNLIRFARAILSTQADHIGDANKMVMQSTDAENVSKNAGEIGKLEKSCPCGKQSIGWCISNSCHKQPGYNYDKTIRALRAATEFKHGAMHLLPRKFWEVYGAPLTQPLIAEAARDDVPPTGWDAEFLSKRLGRVATLVGIPMPDMTHEQIAECAGTILGQIASKLDSGVKRDDVAGDAMDARRYRGITTRYGYSLYTRYISTDGGYSSNGAKEKLDAWADAAADEVEKYDAMTIEEKQADMQRQLDAAIAASKEQK